MLRSHSDINSSVKKACSIEEVAPKRKHVRACVVYTWDHRSGHDFWNAVKLTPVQNDDVQLFKTLILIHKVIQEGHKSVLVEAHRHTNWIRSLARGASAGGSRPGYGGDSSVGYSRLISEYVRFLLHKLDFHYANPAFSGTFEYDEFTSLKIVNDPNEGYQTIIELMNLQDAIDDYQRLVFASFRGRSGNECKISSLVPMVAESYGIHRFLVAMLRVMFNSSDKEALEPLRNRFYAQHTRLRNFYFDVSTLKYLTSLITVPHLAAEPPSIEGEETGPPLPGRPVDVNKTGDTSGFASQASTPIPAPITAQPTGDWWAQQQRYDEEQRQLQAQQEQEALRQQQLALEQQQQFEQQQQMLLAQQQQAQEEFNQQQHQLHAQGRAAELEHQLYQIQSQHESTQQMLQQYDMRVQALESELQQAQSLIQDHTTARNEQIELLQHQVTEWKSKYEGLAKLYSQLRQEHLGLLAKYKQAQTKAASASEAIEKREKLERDLKNKNLELADLIKERDRGRYELDRAKGQHRDEVERLERDILLLNDKLSETQKAKAPEMEDLIATHAREIELLTDKLRNSVGSDELRHKDDEIDILKETVESMEEAFKELSVNKSGGNVSSLVDSILSSATEGVQEALFMFENPAESGNQNATPDFVLTAIEKASNSADEFSSAFTSYFAEGPEGDAAQIVKYAYLLSNAISEILNNTKGLCEILNDEDVTDKLTIPANDAAVKTCSFFASLHSDVVADLELDDKVELVISSHVDLQESLLMLSNEFDEIRPKIDLGSKADVGVFVEDEMTKVANAVQEANAHLTKLMSRPRDAKFTTFDRQINEAIIAAAVAVTSAIAALVRAATDCQQEIVAKGRGSETTAAYYKRNNRWTQGLISAARAVAGSTNVLIETADGTLTGESSPEELIVASKEVAASTAQLVVASKVKSDYMSKSQDKLEDASKSVTYACRSLVTRVQQILASKIQKEEKKVDYAALSEHEFKTASMEQQVEVLRLEQQLQNARNRLFEIRKLEYRDDEE